MQDRPQSDCSHGLNKQRDSRQVFLTDDPVPADAREEKANGQNARKDDFHARRQVCETDFYGGEMAQRAGARDVAVRLFRAAASICATNSVERQSAYAELKAIGELP